MTLLLAQTTPPPQVLASWLEVFMYIVVSAGAIVGLLCGIKSLREKKEATPQPLIVQGHVQFVPREEFDKEIKQAHGRMNRERDDAARAVRELAQRLDGDLAKLTKQVADYNTDANGRANSINGRIDDLRDVIAAMPGELVSLIRSAQQI